MQDLMELINEIAKRKGLGPELYLADLVSRDLDPRGRVDLYLRIHGELLNEADREYAVNNLVRASKKYWELLRHLLMKIGAYPFISDLAKLLSVIKSLSIDVPTELYVYADALSGEYVLSRYPDMKSRVYNKDTAIRCVEYARRIVGFIRSISKDPV